jgi:inhibitor of cysteine peptidase
MTPPDLADEGQYRMLGAMHCRRMRGARTYAGWLTLSVAGALVVGVLLLSCGPSGDDDERTITEADAGETINLTVGETLRVTLEGNPTTGYNWEARPIEPPVLEQVGESDFDPDSDAEGSAGTVTLRFDAVAAGQATLELVYRRAWDDPNAAPHESYAVTVVVTE